MANDTSTLIPEDVQITLVPKRKRTRIWEIDFLRGVCVILMILYHLLLMLSEHFGPAWYGTTIAGDSAGAEFCRWCREFYNSDTLATLHTVVLFVFFSISGISCTFSRSNFRRGLILAGVALLYTLVTYTLESLLSVSGILVTFGVLHFYAVCILAYAAIDFLCRDKIWLRTSICAAIIVVVLCVYFLYTPPADTPLWLGIVFPPRDFFGNESLFYTPAQISPGDLFTLIPWASFFFAGTLLAPLLYTRRCSLLPFLDKGWHKPVGFVGKYAIFFYLAHVVVIAVVLMLISYLFVSPGDWVLI